MRFFLLQRTIIHIPNGQSQRIIDNRKDLFGQSLISSGIPPFSHVRKERVLKRLKPPSLISSWLGTRVTEISNHLIFPKNILLLLRSVHYRKQTVSNPFSFSTIREPRITQQRTIHKLDLFFRGFTNVPFPRLKRSNPILPAIRPNSRLRQATQVSNFLVCLLLFKIQIFEIALIYLRHQTLIP